MSAIVARTCTELSGDADQASDVQPTTLADHRSLQAYVLLGDPGSGKTTAFEAESDAIGDAALLVSARDFLLQSMAPEEVRGKTLFIDGLDEIRAGTPDGRIPLDKIRKTLIQLGRPRFRISCRVSDWLGENDRSALEFVAEANVPIFGLDPLTEENIVEVLRDGLGVGDPETFFMQAHDAGLEGLLDNPQALELLVRAVNQGDGWPTRRLEVFDLACREMASERNQEHRVAVPNNPSTDSILDCAGRLCALLLIADKAGYSLDGHVRDESCIARDPCGQEEPECLRAAVSSRLFKASSERCFGPVHRQIAEFLGGRHLAQLIEDGLSARRVLALIAGSDGVPVTALRGLSAWLATLSEAARSELISKNPADLGIYGDLDTFSGDDKRQVLEALLASPMSLSRARGYAERFAPLACATTEPSIGTVLKSQDRDEQQERRVRFVLLLLRWSPCLPGFQQVILEIIRDRSRSGKVRNTALGTFLHCQEGSSGVNDALKALLDEFSADPVSVEDGDLCGTLLSALYPGTVGPSQIWGYFPRSGDGSSIGRYLDFWKHDLVAQSSPSGIAELLDTLATSVSELESTIGFLGLSDVPLQILERALSLHGENVAASRVAAWLGACNGAARDRASNPPPSLLSIRAWLEGHPDLQKHVVLTGLEACQEGDNVGYADLKNRRRLLGSKVPADFGLWCLTHAVRLADTRPEVAEHLLQQAYMALKTPGVNEGLSFEVLTERSGEHALLKELLDQLLALTQAPQDQESWQQEQSTGGGEQEARSEHLLSIVRSQQDHLRENRAHPGLLHELALVYFGDGAVFGTGLYGEEALRHALRDHSAIEAALYGLRHSVDRDDLPSTREIMQLAKEGTEPYISLALLAALRELQGSDEGRLLDLDENRLRACVACLHCWEPHFLRVGDATLAWYQVLLDQRPDLVSDVAVQCAVSALRGNQTVSPRFWKIVEDQGGDTARSAVLRLLRGLPTRCNSRQTEVIDELIWTGLRSGWQSELLELCEKKLSKHGVDAGQKVRWLGLGLLLNPEKHGEALSDSVAGKERLVRHLARFFVHPYHYFTDEAHAWRLYLESFEPPSLALIFSLLGRFSHPHEPQGYGGVADEFLVSRFVARVINELASRPSSSASAALEDLLENPGLAGWHAALSSARAAQAVLRRDAEYRSPTLQQTCATLGRGRPANACDLAALVVDKIEETALRIRTANSNEWSQYWNLDSKARPLDPKAEEPCRDALLAALRPSLSGLAHSEPEGQQVNQTRADLVITSGNFKIPVEAKKNSHPHLWSAINDQLIPKYTLDPATGGYGIYLVFWFGVENQRKRPDGVEPATPQELAGLLRESLDEDQGRKIDICVVDVSRPSSPATGGRTQNSRPA